LAARTRSSNHRASVAVLLGLAALAAVPAGVVLSRQTSGVRLVDAVWAIPVAALCGIAALLFARGARGRIRFTLDQAGGRGRIRLGRLLAVAGLSVATSAAIAVGFYELLLRLEG
jgi:ABC-type proline/glycine betaine transport system permease subunit